MKIAKSRESKLTSRRSWPDILVLFMAVVITTVICYAFAIEWIAFNQAFPLRTKENGLDLGQTGDFVGGWANSIALIWIITVAFLQYRDLQAQRKEMVMLREENRRQAEAADEQSKTQLQILALEKRRLFFEQMNVFTNGIENSVKDMIKFGSLSAISKEIAYKNEGIRYAGMRDKEAITRFIIEVVNLKSKGEEWRILEEEKMSLVYDSMQAVRFAFEDSRNIAKYTDMEKLYDVLFFNQENRHLYGLSVRFTDALRAEYGDKTTV